MKTLLPRLGASVGALLLLAASASAQTTHPVSVAGLSFTPSTLNINVGDTVLWTWAGGLHNVESGVFGLFDGNFSSGAPTSASGTTFSVTFDAAYLLANPMVGNSYPYYCIVHIGVGMIGTINVNTGVPPLTATYGCGTNPAGSLTTLAGQPQVGMTWTVGVDNPLGTQPNGSFAFLAVASRPDPNFPCGTPLPGFGMSAPGALGELLLSLAPPNPILVLGPSLWAGPLTPAPIAVNFPPDPSLAGLDLYFQGVMADVTFTSGINLGLTEAIQATIGS